MGKRKLSALEKVDADLPALQHKIRGDPLSYRAEFETQYHQYQSFFELFRQAPASAPDERVISLRDLIDFISHVAHCYRDTTAGFSKDLITLLSENHDELEPDLRAKVVSSLVLLRKKGIIDSNTLFNALFPLLVSTSSKSLRQLLYEKLVSDIRASNAKATNHKLNRTLQAEFYHLLKSDQSSAKGLWAVRITRELWRRQIWTDSKAVEIMKESALTDNVKVMLGGVNFFLGGDKEREEAVDAETDDDDAIDMSKLRHKVGINKKTRKGERSLRLAVATAKRQERRKNKPQTLNFSALHLLHDPQTFAETLFQKHLQSNKSKLSLDHKLLVLQLVSRLVGLHKLTIVPLYSYFLRYLAPRQASVTSFLAALGQATHSLVPPDLLEPVIQKIANEFVSEASAGQVAAVGLNAIREVCARQPLAMNDTLLQDLVLYRKSKDKGVMMAAKGLLGLYRDVGPEMLKRRDRGKEAALTRRTEERRENRYGEQEGGGIDGLELLEQWKIEERRKKRRELGLPSDTEASGEDVGADDEDDWKAWDVEEDNSDDSGGWIDVASDGDEIDISDSDDEKPATEKPRFNDDFEREMEHAQPISKLATSRILTPADLAKLNELRAQASINKHLPAHHRQQKSKVSGRRHADDPLTAAEIEGLASLSDKKAKEDKVAAAKADRQEHQSATARRKDKKREQGKSTTNKEKARKKNFLMTIGKARAKNKRSLVETRKVLKGHIERQKRGGRRGNR